MQISSRHFRMIGLNTIVKHVRTTTKTKEIEYTFICQ